MKKFSLLLFCILVAFPTFAKRISEHEALIIAQQFMEGQQMEAGRHLARSKGAAQTSFKNIYVFNVESDGGFVIVSGDDRTQSILGFAEHGRMDMSNLPCNVKWLFEYYDHAISTLDGTEGANINYAKAKSAPARENIATMIYTQWGQGEPYNSFCPQIGEQRCITGCVATAMAQVINYHRWPQAQTAEVPSYTSRSNSILMPNLPKTQFDWNNMSPTAVAQLMLYCGQAVRMDYGVEASGALSGDVPDALSNVFGYSKSASLASRGGYTDEQWDELVYNELSNGRPVLYFGQSPAVGGHAFIVDGYSDGMYHLNWGWNGYCDGYFTLKKLKPTNDAGFNNSQEMIVNVCPPAEVGDISRPKAIVTAMTCSERYLERTGTESDFPVFTVGSTVESDLVDNVTLQVGLALYNDDGLVRILSEETHDFTSSDSYVYETQVSIDASLPQGDYRIVAVNRVNDSDGWLTDAGGITNYVSVTLGKTSMQLQPMPKSSDDTYYIDFGVHTIDGITYQLYSEYENLRAKVLPYEENGKYSGDIYIPDNVSYQNMTFKVYSLHDALFFGALELVSASIPMTRCGPGDYPYICNCPNLTLVELRNGGNMAFAIKDCHALETITYPPSCSIIDPPSCCNSMKSITFANKYGKIKIKRNYLANILWDKKSMPALTDVYFACGVPPVLCENDNSEVSVLITPNDNVTIHIPQGSMDVYKRSIWKDWNLVEDQSAIPVHVNWDYCGNSIEDVGGIAVGNGDDDVEFAMRIPEELIAQYEGCKISRIEFYTKSPMRNDFHWEDVEYVFLTTRDKDYIAKQAVATARGTWMRVELEQPYVITGEELFVGIGRHSALGVDWANLDIVEDGLWCRVMGDDYGGYPPGEWIKHCGDSDWNHPLPIRAIIEGDKLPTDIVIANTEIIDDSEADKQSKVKAVSDENKNIISGKANMTDTERGRYFCYAVDGEGNRINAAKQQIKQFAAEPKKVSGANKQIRVKMRNRTPKLVKSVTLDWEIDGNRKGQQTIETAMLTNHEDIAYIDIPNDIAGRNHTMTVSVSSIDGEPDAIPANSQIEENYSAASSTFFPRKIVMEEATGTWCGWCPRGIVAIEKMNEKYPDNFIAIAVHNDEMIPAFDSYQPFFNMVDGYPKAYINRSYWIDPSPFDLEDVKDTGEAQITATACSSDGKEVQVATETEFGFSDNGSTEYSVAYVLTEDKVGPYAQSNYYSNPETEHDPNNMMDWWVHQNGYVATVYNDVARAIYGDYYGVKGLFPNEIKEGETYKNQYVFSLPDNVQNKENLNVVTLLIDSRTGEIMNADRTPVEIDASGIHQLETDNKLFDVYNTMGMKVRSKVATLKGLPEGIYIVNGKKYVHR